MPITYDFPYNRATELNSRPLKQTRYNFAINSSVDDPWDSRLAPPSPLNPPFRQNHPIDIRMLSPKVESTISWLTTTDTDSSKTHQTSGVGSLSPLQIPNPISVNGSSILNPDNKPSIGSIPSVSELGGSDQLTYAGGMQILANRITQQLENPATGGQNTFNVQTMLHDYVTNIRSLGPVGLTLVMMVMGSNGVNTGPLASGHTFNESNYVEGNSLGDGSWNQRFYDTSSYVTFHSQESSQIAAGTIRSFITNQSARLATFRKSFHYNYGRFQWNESSLLGVTISQSGVGYAGAAFTTLIFANAALAYDLVKNAGNSASVSINADNNETTFANLISTVDNYPSQVQAASHLMALMPYDGSNKLTFDALPGYPNTLFRQPSPALNINRAMIGHSIAYASADSSPNKYWVDGTDSSNDFHIRVFNKPSYGTKNLLAYEIGNAGAITLPRLFAGQGVIENNISHLGIVPGSYVRITPSGINPSDAANSGIYKVLATYEGIESDPTSADSYPNGTSRYQYLELSRSITPLGEVFNSNDYFTYTIENVSHLPILHIKYRQTIQT